MPGGLVGTIRRRRRDRRGSAAIFFALSILPVLFCIGGAIDYARARTKKSTLAQSLDRAILAAARNGQANAAYLQNIMAANLGASTTVPTPSLSTATAGDGSTVYSADARLAVPTAFLKILGINSISVGAHAEATAPGRIVSVTFIPTNTQGAFSKDIFVWTKDSTGAVTSKQTVVTYRYDSATGSKVTTPAIGTQSITFTVPVYATFGLGMIAYKDEVNYSGALVNPVETWSDASNSATFLHQAGNCQDAGGATYNWEDGGDANFVDFVYTMGCVMGPATNSSVRLSR